MLDSLQPHGLQHARPPCPLPTPGACSNSCPLNLWCYQTISSSVILFSTCLQSFPASWSLSTSQLFPWGDQSIGASASASVLPKHIQNWFPLGWTGGSPCSSRDSQESSPTPQFKSINSSVLSFKNCESLCYNLQLTPVTYIILHVNYTSILNNEKSMSCFIL